ncbi:MAG TPA: glutamate--tRNA ligase family protein, partial [Fibrobacteraceae bacterium]|nr:glutamate--tRNA ligase family protein [Fibrobacteraceae bacterium]
MIWTRFAPSPTGYLHEGHVLSAAWVWGMAQRCRAKVLLRIEDHDLSRCREEYVTAIREDLLWLGFHWDRETRQSSHPERYFSAVNRLQQSEFPLYACFCSRKAISRFQPNSPELRYPGTCRRRAQPWQPG